MIPAFSGGGGGDLGALENGLKKERRIPSHDVLGLKQLINSRVLQVGGLKFQVGLFTDVSVSSSYSYVQKQHSVYDIRRTKPTFK